MSSSSRESMVRSSLLLSGALLLSASALDAQTVRASPQQLCLIVPPVPVSVSTRGLAMGNANTTGRDDDVIFYNPARLAIARGTSIAGERYDERTASGTLATVTRLASGGVGVGAHVTSGREFLCNDVGLPPFPPAQYETLAFGSVGFAQTVKRFQLGAAIKYAVNQGSFRATGLRGDLGVARDMSAGVIPFSLGLAFQNIGSSLDDELMPWRIALGGSAGGPLGPFDLNVAAQLATTHDDHFLPAGGLELGYQWLDGYGFALRGGARRGAPLTFEGNFTGGVGLTLDRLSVDYAFETQSGARPLGHRLSLRLR
jgi:hypothetical protein